MTKYLVPLGVFIVGHLVVLVGYVFFGALGDAATTLNTETAVYSDVFWNWAWVSNVSVITFMVFFFLEMGILFATFKAFMAVR